jgi:hypothetical protein
MMPEEPEWRRRIHEVWERYDRERAASFLPSKQFSLPRRVIGMIAAGVFCLLVYGPFFI